MLQLMVTFQRFTDGAPTSAIKGHRFQMTTFTKFSSQFQRLHLDINAEILFLIGIFQEQCQQSSFQSF